jgi:hypothetical protein
MPNQTSVLTQPRRRARSVSDAIHNCHAACDLTDVHVAFGCLQTLLARARRPDEDDADVCDGVAAIVRLINESLIRREEAAFEALKAMTEVIDREAGVISEG